MSNHRIDPSKPNPSIEELHADYLSGMPMKDMSLKWGYTPEWLRKRLKKANVSPRSHKGLPAHLIYPSERLMYEPTNEQWQVILGSILGDGTLSSTTPRNMLGGVFTHSHLRLLHTSKQLSYLIYKHEILNPIACPIHSLQVSDGTRVYFQTKSNPFFTALRNRWYPAGTKIIYTPDLNTLDLLGLAIWFMDDGTFGLVRNKYPYGFLCTDGFSHEEQFLLQDFLYDRFSIKTTVVSTNVHLHRLRISKDGILKMREELLPYLIDSMKYKLGC